VVPRRRRRVGRGASAQEKKAETGNQEEIRALLTVTDEAARQGDQQPAVKWEQHHFIKSHGRQDLRALHRVVDAAAFAAPTPVGFTSGSPSAGSFRRRPRAAKEADKKKKKDKKDDSRATGSQVDARHEYPFEDVFFIDCPPRSPGSRSCFGARLPCRPATTTSTSR
jgi:hypothetical protein